MYLLNFTVSNQIYLISLPLDFGRHRVEMFACQFFLDETLEASYDVAKLGGH